MLNGQSLGWRLFLVADAGDGKWAPGVEGAALGCYRHDAPDAFFRFAS